MSVRIILIVIFTVLSVSHSFAQEKYLFPFTPYGNASDYILKNDRLSLDDNGIPYFNYGTAMSEAGKRYNSGFISNYAQALYRDYLQSGDKKTKEKFMNMADWLLDQVVYKEYKNKKFIVFQLDFDNDKFGAKAPWFSGWLNGKALPVFLYAYDLTKDSKFKSAADLTFNAFTVPMEVGGLSTFINDGIVWFEEVAKKNIESSKILNGHIYATASIYTYWKWTKDPIAYDFVKSGVNAVINDIEKYDAGYLSFYSQHPDAPRIAAPVRGYNSLHISQLMWLYSIENNSKLLKYALRFSSYEDSFFVYGSSSCINCEDYGPDNLRMYLGKKYYSSNKFPTTLKIDLMNELIVESLTLLKYNKNNDPESLDIYINHDGVDQHVDFDVSEDSKYLTLLLNEPVKTDNFQIKIENTKNRVFALSGIGIKTKYPNPNAVSDFETFRSSNRPAFIFADGWKMYAPCSLYIDKTGFKQMSFLFSKTNDFDLKIYGSNDLQVFEKIDFVKKGNETIEILSDFRYLKLEQSNSPKQILKAKYER